MRKPIHIISVIVLFVFLAFAWSQQQDAKQFVGIGFFKDFFPEADKRDIQVSLNLWTNEIIKISGYDCQTSSIIFDDLHDLISAVQNNKIHLICTSSIDFVDLRSVVALEPVLTMKTGDKFPEKFVLLTHRDYHINTLDDLSGKKVLLPSGSTTSKLIKMWLDVELFRAGKKQADEYFREIKYISKESQLVLSVFFKQSDACVVSLNAYETMKQLNPQVGQELQIIQQSPEYIGAVLCVVGNFDPRLKRIFKDIALALGKYSYYKQYQALFRFEEFVPISEQYIKDLEELVKEYNTLKETQ